MDGVKLGGVWRFVCKDSDGNIKWVDCIKNLVTNEGLNSVLNVYLHGATPITEWYIAPFSTDTTTLATHTYAAPGYTESTAYTEATRQAYVEAGAFGQSITNSASPAIITSSAVQTIYGCGLVGGGSAASTKGDTAGGGVLFCAAKLPVARSLEIGDTLELLYTLNAADDGV